MIKILKLIFIIVFLSISYDAFAKKSIKVKNLRFKKNSSEGRISIKLKGQLQEEPELEIKNNMLQVSLPGTFVWPKIEKSISLNKKFDTKILAYQFDKKTVRFRTILPFSLKGRESQVEIFVRKNRVEVVFPKLIGKTYKLVKKTKPSDFDESYLNKLLKDKESIPDVEIKKVKQTVLKPANVKKLTKHSDRVKTAMAAGKKGSKSQFSLWVYAAKAGAFLVLVLFLFYGLVNLMKKGVFKKGKLGFLNSTKIIEVLNTSYIGPKRSLILVRVHKQIFLMASTEKGMEFLSEIDNTAELLKEGERQISGTNFDTNLKEVSKESKEFHLKEILQDSEDKETTEELTHSAEKIPAKDKVKFSEQIKNKIKDLKSLQ